MISAVRASDIWFGIVAAVFFGGAAIFFFGPMVIEPSFWTALGVIVAFAAIAVVLHALLRNVQQPLKAMVLLGLGSAFAYVYLVVRGSAIDLFEVISYGVLFAILDVFFPERGEEQANG